MRLRRVNQSGLSDSRIGALICLVGALLDSVSLLNVKNCRLILCNLAFLDSVSVNVKICRSIICSLLLMSATSELAYARLKLGKTTRKLVGILKETTSILPGVYYTTSESIFNMWSIYIERLYTCLNISVCLYVS